MLNPGESPNPRLKLYAHCLHDSPGGVALLVINTDRDGPMSLEMAGAAERYTLTAPDLLGARVDLNGTELKTGTDGSLPKLSGNATKPGQLTFAPASITFLAIPKAKNAACR